MGEHNITDVKHDRDLKVHSFSVSGEDIQQPAPKKQDTIDQMIAEIDIQEVMQSIPGQWPYPPRDYQVLAFKKAQDKIRSYEHPFIIKAAVSAGKSLILAMILRRIRDISMRSSQRALLLCRQGEIVEQDRDEASSCGVIGSTMCASLGDKSAQMPIVFGSEQTVANAMQKGGAMEDVVFRFLLIDECHHVDIADIIESESAVKEMSEEEYFTSDNPVLEPAEVTFDDMTRAGRKVMTKVIREFQRRCLKRYNRPLVIIGVTGTDYRGTTPIVNSNLSKPGFWREKILDISTKFLVSRGFVVPTTFGSTDGLGYDLSEFKSRGREGDDEFSAEDIAAMEAKITESSTETQKVMLDVLKRTINRNAVLVTCAGKRHCQDAANCLPEGVSFCIITDDMNSRERRQKLKEAKLNRIKFIFQVGCLTTGINCPPWDTIVIMRKIGSLTLLEQLIGRGQRLLQQIHKDMGMVKNDNLVLDYAGAMHELAGLYFSDVLEDYEHQVSVEVGKTVPCPVCQTMNSEYARRCIHVNPVTGNRCSHFFVYRLCDDFIDKRTGKILSHGCGAKNDTVARYCSSCNNVLIDPNKPLKANAYTRDDFNTVLSWKMEAGKGDSIAIKYDMRDSEGNEFSAYEIHHPLPTANKGSLASWRKKFLVDHVPDPKIRAQIQRLKSISAILERVDDFAVPVEVTYRKSEKGRGVFGHKNFPEVEF